MIRNTDLKLSIGLLYKEKELIEMGMISMNDHNMDISIYEHGPRIYFFDKIDDFLLKLICVFSVSNFFLS